jgi:cell wall-associated NlpC family hydrolase
MSIEAAIGRIDQILTLQQQVRDPASVATASSSTTGGASLTAGNGSGSSSNFAAALASAQAGVGQSAIGGTSTGLAGLPSGLTGLPSGLTGTSTGLAGIPSAYGATPSTLGTPATTGVGGGTAVAGDPRVQAMVNTANSLVGKPYVWGGGHSGWAPQSGYDCSGFVSAVLHAGGYLSSPADTVSLPSQAGIEQGPGQHVTIYDRSGAGENGHVIIEINGQFYESGGESGAWGGGGGVAKIGTPSASYLATFNAVLHPAGL